MKPVKIVVLIAIFLCGKQAFSQTGSFTPEWAYGINGGMTLSKVGFNSYLTVPQEYLKQYSGGITVRYISEQTFGIQVELNYSQRGWKERTDSVNLNNSYARSIAYLEIPIMTHVYFNLGKPVRLIFNIGPQIGFYIGEKEVGIINIHNYKENEAGDSYYRTSVQHSFDYGLKGSMGLEFRTKIGSFILDGRYYFGLSDIFNSTRGDFFQASPNQIIGVNLSYLFRTK